MASPSIQAVGHRARQALRPRYELAETPEGKVLTNPCDWLHDTVVTNRAEKRRALALAKKYRCSKEKKPDEKRGTETTWVHGKRCPKYEPPEKTVVVSPEPVTPEALEQAAGVCIADVGSAAPGPMMIGEFQSAEWDEGV